MFTRRQILTGTGAIAGTGLFPFLTDIEAEAAAAKNVSYGPNRLDIYPAAGGASNAPVLVWVHGGAWRAGNKSRVGSKAKYFTSKGYMFVSVGYTLYPRATALTQARQIGKAVSWVRANAGKYGGNGSRLALMGHSAGCHLASLATLSGAATGVRALICNDTRAYDLPYLASRNRGRIPTLYSALNNKKYWSSWSPISYAGLKSQPPTLVAWSNGAGRDAISKHFASALSREGTSVTRYDGTRYNHLSINSRMGAESGGITAAVTRFLESRIG